MEESAPQVQEEEEEDSAVRLEAVSDNFACLNTNGMDRGNRDLSRRASC